MVDVQVQVEAAAAAAWPAGRTDTAAGWLLRHTPGVPRRRSNSALPPAPDRHPERTLEAVEAFYTAAGLPVAVQVSPAGRHRALDAALAARGYRREAPTLVLVAPVGEVLVRTAPAADRGPGAAVTIGEAADEAWASTYRSVHATVDTSAVVERVLARVPSPAAFARAEVAGRGVATGLFVADGQWTGVFCMTTHPDHRRRGIARAILGAGARWAAARGCAGLYLQVEQDNVAAREVYARSGFAHSHDYHYRVSDSPGRRHSSASTSAL
ncbi:hypothetical protein GCM10020358_51310 [Amorphoplanes nipponensis]|uniref:N-acetyltransferase domain-containing protein n=1 Tax=Actinoplanes nipponensis TaxID=135950 RepID=A0A919JQ36_9ACTN|nr:GNAT family N-acetyltransferase [Actinoplanes nipponensis]GIE50889.1 hypothetical protein Ani05nite_44230 [Actinoplanes nipponensis]